MRKALPYLVFSWLISIGALGWAIVTALCSTPSDRIEESRYSGYTDSRRYTYKAKPDERGTSVAPLVVRMEYTEEQAKKAEDDERYANESLQINRRQMLFNFLLVACGVAQAVIIVVQLNIMRSQHKTQRAELRAYVSINPQSISFDALNNVITVKFECINHGKTAAKDVEYRCVFGISAWAHQQIPLWPIEEGWTPKNFNLFPNATNSTGDRGEVSVYWHRPFKEHEIEWIREEIVYVYVGIEIQYWDFVVNSGHVTRSYFRISGHPAALKILTAMEHEEIEVTNILE